MVPKTKKLRKFRNSIFKIQKTSKNPENYKKNPEHKKVLGKSLKNILES